ncbi:amidohydrolase family protein [Streptomyces sp. NPDC059740]|uniref:amidohydrolase family protein n=1 Tax=Streptomyces sp. NPDC059740 TaxID=3346926 RepID=UPI00365FA592
MLLNEVDTMSEQGRIDTHHHVVPPAYRDWLARRGVAAGGMPIPAWDAATDIAFMDRHGIATGVLSLSTPGTHLGDDEEALTWARKVNDHCAETVKDRPDRFGFFATLPLPHLDGALSETARALDELGADGIVLLTNHRDTYLGDAAFEPLMAELDRRGATVFVHPSQLPAQPVPGLPPYAADFLLDTVRAAMNLTVSGTVRRHPSIRFVLSHGGGFLPYAAHRISQSLQHHQQVLGAREGMDHDAVLAGLQSFHFDTALSTTPQTLAALLSFAGPERVLFGSDFPYASPQMSSYFIEQYDAQPLDGALRAAIDRGNAARLLPRLAR